jgi:RNA polymerase subunit RPABC4/transcription elongation factor Spt4
LEEEILLHELEQAPTCYNCGRPVQPDWQYCPYCEKELKHPCPQCGYLLEPEWKRCPKCGAPAENFTASRPAVAAPAASSPEPLSLQPETIALPESEPEPAPSPEDASPETLMLPETEAVARAEAIKSQGWQSED